MEEGSGSGHQDDATIKRSQSSLELLSNTALLNMTDQDGQQEELESAGSSETASSARVTPSLSQASMAAAAAAAAAAGQQVASSSEDTQEKTSKTQVPTASSPHRSSTDNPVGGGGEDPTGLPIDHHHATTTALTYAAAPSGFLPQSPYLSHHHQTVQPPPPPPSQQHVPFFGTLPRVPNAIAFSPPLFPQNAYVTATGGGQQQGSSPALHAAFVPPRSNSTIRTSTSSDASSPTTHYAARQPQAQSMQYQQPVARQPPQHPTLHPQEPVAAAHQRTVKPCESFQSDSTASLSSESKFQTPRGERKHKEFKTSSSTPPASTRRGSASKAPAYAELQAANQMLQQENSHLKFELEKRNQEIAVLRGEVRELDNKVKELRQFPAGKISQIPMADMLEIMQIYGSELSDTVMPPRKLNIQKASVIRQFRRWNPNFLKYFFFKDGKWLPKLGREGELSRRQTTRKKGVKGAKIASPNFEDGGGDEEVPMSPEYARSVAQDTTTTTTPEASHVAAGQQPTMAAPAAQATTSDTTMTSKKKSPPPSSVGKNKRRKYEDGSGKQQG